MHTEYWWWNLFENVPFQTSVSYHIATRLHNPEDHDLNVSVFLVSSKQATCPTHCELLDLNTVPTPVLDELSKQRSS